MAGFGYGFHVDFLGCYYHNSRCIGMVVFRKKKGYENSGQSALDMLKERYAKGEINKEEYEEKKKIFKLTY